MRTRLIMSLGTTGFLSSIMGMVMFSSVQSFIVWAHDVTSLDYIEQESNSLLKHIQFVYVGYVRRLNSFLNFLAVVDFPAYAGAVVAG
ncbi:hypothetical protein F5B22DRAFT_269317 [Xylaria bambusicola]|uniref:uncharacterized protein n=1 Tax=Xylaria bambusicola TaxID=326684 RepID=UPI0020078959|nr:uncharacterized protein F5B22DRAFT_269317 [Xylaria bambusicola]KAI0526118.1 hypothetical protein F5B22DRAFT_269317 [Xylaria bambusicola]